MNDIRIGHCMELFKDIPDNCVDLCICSPPYFNQRIYTDSNFEIGREKEIDDYISSLINVFKECVRVTSDTGSIVFNIGDKWVSKNLMLIPYKFAIEVEKLKLVKLLNTLTWIKTNPTPRQFKRRMVSSTEPFFHYVKTDNYLYNNMSDVVEIEAQPNTKIGQGYFFQIENSNLNDEQKALARIELQEVIEEIKRGEIKSLRMKIMGKHSLPFGGQEGGRINQMKSKGFTIIRVPGKYSLQKDVFESPVETIRGIKHPAIYPQSIIEHFIEITTPKEGLVFDPFIGSGTTAIAALNTGRFYLGFELSPIFANYAKKRIQACLES